jgi:hypothetical protein
MIHIVTTGATLVFCFLFLSTSWLCQKGKICDELVFMGQITAPKATWSACWMVVSAYVLFSMPEDAWFILNLIVMFMLYSEFWTIINVFTKAVSESKSMKIYFDDFVSQVLKEEDEISQSDFEKAVNNVIKYRLANNAAQSEYFWIKCSKFALEKGFKLEV